ncbi:molybdopterin cofactor biosynthesis protein [Bordetella pertussis]|nr:molybdopterin cofactor biosynthesis protein [Bordetella pertussis]
MRARLRIGVLTTGDELVAPGQPRAAQQIYNSNGPMLAALVRGMGAQVSHVLHARDDEDALRAALCTLLADSDLVLSSGGSRSASATWSSRCWKRWAASWGCGKYA